MRTYRFGEIDYLNELRAALKVLNLPGITVHTRDLPQEQIRSALLAICLPVLSGHLRKGLVRKNAEILRALNGITKILDSADRAIRAEFKTAYGSGTEFFGVEIKMRSSQPSLIPSFGPHDPSIEQSTYERPRALPPQRRGNKPDERVALARAFFTVHGLFEALTKGKAPARKLTVDEAIQVVIAVHQHIVRKFGGKLLWSINIRDGSESDALSLRRKIERAYPSVSAELRLSAETPGDKIALAGCELYEKTRKPRRPESN